MDDCGCYLPLSQPGWEVRLLQVLMPADPSRDVVVCSMARASLMQPAPFVALSYCWGDPKITTAIIVNNKEFQVTVNLEAALRELRQTLSLQPVWIDALCINQADAIEKEQQIPLMGTIYSRATRVLAWLGRSNREIDLFARATKDIPSDLDVDNESAVEDMNSRLELDEAFISDVLGDSRITKPYLRRLCAFACLVVRLFTKPWWRRLWVLQEQALANDLVIHCGPHSWAFRQVFRCLCVCLNRMTTFDEDSDAREFFRVLTMAALSGTAESETLTMDSDRWGQWLGFKGDFLSWYRTMMAIPVDLDEISRNIRLAKGTPLQVALARTTDRQATDQRDRVFALMALLPESERSKIRVDYRSPPARVFQNTIVAAWDIWSPPFAMEIYDPVSSPMSPSWVPDLASPNAYMQVFGDSTQYSWVNTPTIAPPRRIGGWDYIFWSGSPVDRITWSARIPADFDEDHLSFVRVLSDIRAGFKRAAQVVIPDADPARFMERLKRRHGVSEIMTRLLSKHPPYLENNPELESRLDEILEEPWVADGIATMCGGRSQHAAIRQFISSRVLEHLSSNQPGQEIDENHESYRRFCLAAEFIAHVREYSLGFSFFTTARGFLGFTKAHPMINDEIVLMMGMEYPIILRHDQSTVSSRIKGLAFVSGLMNFKELERKYYNRGKLPLKEFKIG